MPLNMISPSDKKSIVRILVSRAPHVGSTFNIAKFFVPPGLTGSYDHLNILALWLVTWNDSSNIIKCGNTHIMYLRFHFLRYNSGV